MSNVFENMIEVFEKGNVKDENKISNKNNKSNQYASMMDTMKRVKG